MSKKPEEVTTAPPGAVESLEGEAPANVEQGTAQPDSLSTTAAKPAPGALNMADITIGSQPAPAGGIGDDLAPEPQVGVGGLDAEKNAGVGARR